MRVAARNVEESRGPELASSADLDTSPLLVLPLLC